MILAHELIQSLFPILETKDLQEFLPHRNEMIWIDKVIGYHREGIGQCIVKISQNKDRPIVLADRFY